jgi:hypothetical protein
MATGAANGHSVVKAYTIKTINSNQILCASGYLSFSSHSLHIKPLISLVTAGVHIKQPQHRDHPHRNKKHTNNENCFLTGTLQVSGVERVLRSGNTCHIKDSQKYCAAKLPLRFLWGIVDFKIRLWKTLNGRS